MSNHQIKQAIDKIVLMPLKPKDLILIWGELDGNDLLSLIDMLKARCSWSGVIVRLAKEETIETLPMGSFLEIAEQVFKKALGPGWDEYRSATTRLLQIEKSKDAACDI